MTHKEVNKKFLEDFNSKYPNFIVLEYTNIGSPIVFKDDDGIIHKKNMAKKCISHGVRKDSILNKEEYVSSKLNEIFPNLKLLKFNGFKQKILIQDENGFEYTPRCSDLLNNHPISIQTCTKKYDLFVFKANLKHNNIFEYPEFKYINGKQKIEIECKIHGSFLCSVESHLWGSGCPKCGYVGFSKESWLKRLKNERAIFYILEMFNEEEKFIKVGITSTNIEDRYKNLKEYQYNILLGIQNSPSYVYDIEKEILKKFKHSKVIPKKLFGGKTECLDVKCLEDLMLFIKSK